MKKLAILVALILSACTDEGNSRKALEAEEFTNIEFTGYSMFSCSDDDAFRTGFKATNSHGKRVSGVVCCGWLKGCTIRY